MFFWNKKTASVRSDVKSPALTQLAAEIRALRPPTPSLYITRAQERITAHYTRLDEIDSALLDIRAEAYRAAVVLHSLNVKDFVVVNFAELTNRGHP